MEQGSRFPVTVRGVESVWVLDNAEFIVAGVGQNDVIMLRRVFPRATPGAQVAQAFNFAITIVGIKLKVDTVRPVLRLFRELEREIRPASAGIGEDGEGRPGIMDDLA